MSLEIITNNQPRDSIYWHDLTDKEKSQFDWIENPDESGESFVRYRGSVYCISEFMRCKIPGWHGIHGESYFSAILMRLSDDCESVVMARAYS